jgi:hypothetical protein
MKNATEDQREYGGSNDYVLPQEPEYNRPQPD